MDVDTKRVRSVTVVSPDEIFVQLPARSLLITCEFYPQSRPESYDIVWDKVLGDNIILVIYKFSAGNVISGQDYKHRAQVKENCTLQLDSPTVEDSGKYKVTVIVPSDQKHEERRSVHVNVIPDEPVYVAPTKITTLITEKTGNVTVKAPTGTATHPHQYQTGGGQSLLILLIVLVMTPIGIMLLVLLCIRMLTRFQKIRSRYQDYDKHTGLKTDGKDVPKDLSSERKTHKSDARTPVDESEKEELINDRERKKENLTPIS